MKKFLIYLCLILLVFVGGCGTKDKGDAVEPIDPIIPDNPVDPDDGEDRYGYQHTKLLMCDTKTQHIELENVSADTLTENTKILKIVNGEVVDGSYDDLYLGMENIYVKTKNNKYIEQILVDGEPVFNNIRVAIRNSINDISDDKTLYHDSVTIQTILPTIIKTYDGKNAYKAKSHVYLTFTVKDNNIICYNNKVLIKSDKRLIIKGSSKGLLVTSISRSVGIPNYEGDLELSIVNSRLLLTNDIKVEDYLKKVVPSEMPASWDMEALKAQAVAARTYAYKEMYNAKAIYRGYVVDDSTSSQVYNNGAMQSSTNTAVKETKGITMFYQDKPIVAYYYSAGCGLKASGNEVWITDKVVDDIPYLQGGNVSTRPVDTSDESDVLKFFKDLNIVAPSINSSRFRWHIPMTREQLRNTLNKNLPLMVPGKEASYKILKDGKWVSGEFPRDIGKIDDVFVSERGKSGVVISLQVVANNVTFRIYNQFNIRFTVRPRSSDCGSDVNGFSSTGNRYTYTNHFNNPSILPSGFFALEWVGDTLNIYGGGNGHGVGMDQYGAHYLGEQGKTFKEILETYYTNIHYVDTSKEYEELKDFEKYFK